MPTYQYHCLQCGHKLEELQSITEPPLTHCPSCNTENLVRGIGGGAGLIFKGSGFYLTDYVKGDGKVKATPKSAESNSESTPATPADKMPPTTSPPSKKAE